jgi:pyrroloquinoline quinone (PQQ) biosynthesis protein C
MSSRTITKAKRIKASPASDNGQSVQELKRKAPDWIDLKIPLRLGTQEKEISCFTQKISAEGLQVMSDTPLSEGTPLELQCSFADVCYLNLSGQVALCTQSRESASGAYEIQIKFSAIRELEQKILVSAVEALKQSPPMQEKSLVKIQVSQDTLALEAAELPAHTAESHSTESPKEGKTRKGFTPHPEWVLEMNHRLAPYRNAIVDCKLVQGGSTGILPLKKMRAWIIQLYPFIETFPKWIALIITKTHDPRSRGYMIDNLRMEKKHAEQWVNMAQGFGIDPYVLHTVEPLPEVEAITHWLWSINTRGSLAEAVGATNFSIEGVTQDIAKLMIKGFPYYDGKEGICLDKKAYWWAQAHSRYDDLHPEQALEVMKMYASTKELQEKAVFATQRSYEYLLMALEACYTYEDATEIARPNAHPGAKLQ